LLPAIAHLTEVLDPRQTDPTQVMRRLQARGLGAREVHDDTRTDSGVSA
jgi:hypothetical protein